MTVTGVDDALVDGDITYTVILAAASSADTNYNTRDPDDVSVTNTDDDSASITISNVTAAEGNSGAPDFILPSHWTPPIRTITSSRLHHHRRHGLRRQ